MGFKNWETPPDFFKALDDEFHFTLDAAASHENHLLSRYCTKTGVWEWGIDRLRPSLGERGWLIDPYQEEGEADGLSHHWHGERVFCNPPYDSSLYQWVEKALKREAEISVLLLPASTDTLWFHLILDKLGECLGMTTKVIGTGTWRGIRWTYADLLFRAGRLKFLKDGAVGDQPRGANMLLVVWGRR